MTTPADYPGVTLCLGTALSLVRFQLMWVTVTVVGGGLLVAQGTPAAQSRSQTQSGTVSVQDLESKGSLSKQQIFEDIVALAKAREDSLTGFSTAPVNAGRGQSGGARGGNGLSLPAEAVGSENYDPALKAGVARAHAFGLESELQKAMTRADIDSAVRTWNQLNSPTAKLKSPPNVQDALQKPTKRSDAVRALAGRIDRATNEWEMVDARKFLLTVGAAPIGSTSLVDLLLEAQHADALTGACASLVLSQISLSPEQAQQMMQGLSRQRITKKSDPIIQHLLDAASQFVSSFPTR